MQGYRWRGALVASAMLAVSLVSWSRGEEVMMAGGGTQLLQCRVHEDCGSEFCMESVCLIDGFDLPCTRCASCPACSSPVSVDGACPAWCPRPENQVQRLQGMFTELDGDGCIGVWFFENDNFRYYDTGVSFE